MFKGLLRRKSKTARRAAAPALSFDDAKQLVLDKDTQVRSELARRGDLKPELLYYLAEDQSAEVRRNIAANPETPRQADMLLAKDVDEEVRCDLALKIGRLIPGLSDQETSLVQDLTFEILNILAQDQLPRVRHIIAEEIKLATNVPRNVIARLANDVELIVAAPILEYSILLSDDELLEIIARGPIGGALATIALRSNVSEKVSDAIVDANDVPSIATLLANQNAQIREETLDKIIDKAPEVPPWHEPQVDRPSLSQRAVRRIAGFVTSSLITILQERHEMDTETVRVVSENVKLRLQEPEAEAVAVTESPLARAQRLFEEGKIDDELVVEAATQGQRELAVQALALRSSLEAPIVRSMLESKTGKAVTALAWKAELQMRTAMSLQRHLARIPPHAMVNARNGVDYPLTAQEMDWYISYFEEYPAKRAAAS